MVSSLFGNCGLLEPPPAFPVAAGSCPHGAQETECPGRRLFIGGFVRTDSDLRWQDGQGETRVVAARGAKARSGGADNPVQSSSSAQPRVRTCGLCKMSSKDSPVGRSSELGQLGPRPRTGSRDVGYRWLVCAAYPAES